MDRVEDIMRTDVVKIAPASPAIEVAQKMATDRDGVVAVCNDGRYLGLIDSLNLVNSIVARARNPKREHARNLINGNGHIHITPGDTILDAARMMTNNRVRLLPVVKGGKLVGIISAGDIARENLAVASLIYSETARELTAV